MKHFTYKWFTYHLLVACPRCGNKIPMQGIEGHPECTDCGHTMSETWPEALDFAGVDELKKEKDYKGSKVLMGTMNANAHFAKAEGIPCMHCKKTVAVTPDTEPGKISCNHCEKPLRVASSERLKDLVFYKNASGSKTQPGHDMVAVRCASCGAPLQADPAKNNYHCQFCHTENILPPSMRRKVVVDDMYVGIQVQRFPPEFALTNNSAEQTKRILRDNKRTDYTDEQLDQITMRFPNNLDVLNFMRYEYKHAVPGEVYNQLWNKTTNVPMMFEAGRALKKEQSEMEARADKMDPNRLKKQQEKKAAVKKASNKKNKKYIVIAILIGLAIYFGWQAIVYYANKK